MAVGELQNPIRLQVLKNLEKVLSEISPANGYVEDFSGTPRKVWRGRIMFGDGDTLPCLNILETPIDIEQTPSPDQGVDSTGEWDVLIQGFLPPNEEEDTLDRAYVAIADIKKRLAKERKAPMGTAIGQDKLGMGGLVKDIYIGAGTVRPPDENSTVVYFWLRITIKIVDQNENPYNLTNP